MPGPDDPNHAYNALVAKAWADEDFKSRLLSDPADTLRSEGWNVPAGTTVKVVEAGASPERHDPRAPREADRVVRRATRRRGGRYERDDADHDRHVHLLQSEVTLRLDLARRAGLRAGRIRSHERSRLGATSVRSDHRSPVSRAGAPGRRRAGSVRDVADPVPRRTVRAADPTARWAIRPVRAGRVPRSHLRSRATCTTPSPGSRRRVPSWRRSLACPPTHRLLAGAGDRRRARRVSAGGCQVEIVDLADEAADDSAEAGRTPVPSRSSLPCRAAASLPGSRSAEAVEPRRVGDGSITVRLVLVADYLQPELAELNASALRSRPSLAARQAARTAVWVGPVFRPGSAAAGSAWRSDCGAIGTWRATSSSGPAGRRRSRWPRCISRLPARWPPTWRH